MFILQVKNIDKNKMAQNDCVRCSILQNMPINNKSVNHEWCSQSYPCLECAIRAGRAGPTDIPLHTCGKQCVYCALSKGNAQYLQCERGWLFGGYCIYLSPCTACAAKLGKITINNISNCTCDSELMQALGCYV